MAARIIEAKLLISGEDRASGEIAKVVKSVKQFEDAAKVSKQMESVAKVLRDIEQASRVTDAALKARAGYAAAEAGMKATQGAARATAQALNDARIAKAAFDGVKAAKGTEQARQIEVVTKAYRDAGTAYRKVENDMRKANAAVAAQATSMKAAETAAARFGADLGNLESHQVRLRSATESATNAVRAQIRVEDAAARSAAQHAKERAEQARHARQHGVVNLAATAASGAVGVHGVVRVAERAAHAGAEVQSTRVDMAKAGIGFTERQHIADESLKLATTYKNVTQAGVMEMWKEMRSVMTDPHEVDHVIDSMVRAKSLLDARDATGTASHGLNLLVKGAENIGAAKDPERFNKLIDGYMKAMQVMGKTITPEGIYEAQKYSKAAGGRWSDRFIMTTMQSLGQEMGGSTAGNSVQMAQKQIVSGMQNQHSKAKEFARIGLIDPKNLDYLKTGEVKGTKAGVKHAVKGDDLAATDFDKWVYSVLLPHMEKAGIKNQGDQLAWVQKSFTSTAADVVSKLIVQRESFDAHAKMYENATGLKGTALNRSDPNAALGEVTKSLETFLGVVTSPIMVQAAHALDEIATGISGFTVKLDAFNKAHPTIAKAEGPAALALGLGAAGGASVLTYKLLSGGFGLKGSAVALDAAAAALTEAAVVQSAKGAVASTAAGAAGTTAAGGAAAGGVLGPTILGAGIVGGALLDSQVTSGAGELQENRDRWEKLTSADKAGAAIGYTAPQGKRPLVMPGASAGAPVTSSFRVNREGWFDNFLNGQRTDTYNLPGFGGGRKMAIPPEAREAGQKAGDAIKQGLSDKAPEVEQQGQSIFERLQAVFSRGILVPINFAPGEGMGGGGGLIQKASYGGGGGGGEGSGLGGLVHRASLGGGGGGGGSGVGGASVGGSGGSGGSGGIGQDASGGRVIRSNLGGGRVTGANEDPNANARESWDFWKSKGLSDEAAAGLLGMEQGENQFRANSGQFGGYGDGGAAYGTFMHRAPRRKQILAGTGINIIGAPHSKQLEAAYWEMTQGPDAQARQAWKRLQEQHTPGSAAAIGVDLFERPLDRVLNKRVRGGYANNWYQRFKGTAPPAVRADEPRLVKGLDGKEGLDLGNGAMKMPDGSMRPIPSASGLTIPEAPAGGFGGGRRGADHAAWEAVADRMHGAAERFENASFHGQIDIRGHNGVQASGMRVRSRGAISADMGVSMPGAKESDGDWV